MDALNRREFLGKCGRMAAACAGCSLLPMALPCRTAHGVTLKKGYVRKKLSPYYTALEGETVRCDLCPHHCEVDPGDRGLCDVRENINGKYYSMVYENPCAIHVDPIEKKPFFHVLPGTDSFSIATAGCNFDCKFCQNWSISQARPEETRNYSLSSVDAISLALENDCASIASTYVEPSIFMEYMLDIGKLARQEKLLKVIHSNGFVAARPLADLCGVLDAACIDLKGFTEDYYRDMTGGGSLAPVLETLKALCQKKIHTEIVTLIIPGRNDDMVTLRAMCDWIVETLGPDVPLHFTRFYPQYKLKALQPTPVATLEAAHRTAREAGLHYVYLGNVYGHAAENTYCPGCGEMVIKRAGYETTLTGLAEGHCSNCRTEIAGVWSLSGLR